MSDAHGHWLSIIGSAGCNVSDSDRHNKHLIVSRINGMGNRECCRRVILSIKWKCRHTAINCWGCAWLAMKRELLRDPVMRFITVYRRRCHWHGTSCRQYQVIRSGGWSKRCIAEVISFCHTRGCAEIPIIVGAVIHCKERDDHILGGAGRDRRGGGYRPISGIGCRRTIEGG